MGESVVQFRRIPYPYRAMLAICSDLDETPDCDVYRNIMRFLNTTRPTTMGPGVGLEVGNTIYFDMPPEQFAYWNTNDAGRHLIRSLIRSGHIDCLHSYGDLATTREHAGRALDELSHHDCRLEVWVDHGTAATNFGSDIMHGHGDEPGHPAYHADLTLKQGVRFVWRGRVTSVIGQDVPHSLRGLWTSVHPLVSAKTVVLEEAKHLLGLRGHPKYAMHGPNAVLRQTALRDNAPVIEFMRSNPHWGGVSSCEKATGIGQVLTQSMLERLVRRGGVCILYTHLGKIADPRNPFPPSAIAAFQRLSDAHRSGLILVTTTRRLLGHCLAVRQARFVTRQVRDIQWIEISLPTRKPPDEPVISRRDLDGVTLYVPDAQRIRVTIETAEVSDILRNPPDHTGMPSVSLPWRRLEYPDP